MCGKVFADVLHGLPGLLQIFSDDLGLLSADRPEFLKLLLCRFKSLLVRNDLTLELVHLLGDFVGLVLRLQLFECLAFCVELALCVLDCFPQ